MIFNVKIQYKQFIFNYILILFLFIRVHFLLYRDTQIIIDIHVKTIILQKEKVNLIQFFTMDEFFYPTLILNYFYRLKREIKVQQKNCKRKGLKSVVAILVRYYLNHVKSN